MSFIRRHAVPFAAGVAAAATAFAIIALTTGDGAERRAPVGGETEHRTDPTPDGLAIFNRMGCGGCHQLAAANSSGPIAPNLDERLPAHTRESLRVAILSPPPSAVMPQDFGKRMNEAELEALIDFLLASSPR
jgi:mono/diheme cytochrome c family protein